MYSTASFNIKNSCVIFSRAHGIWDSILFCIKYGVPLSCLLFHDLLS